jgi:putative transposase
VQRSEERAERNPGLMSKYYPNPEGVAQRKTRTMPQSLAKVFIHVVYSTKHRKTWLQDEKKRSELYQYLATILKDNVDSPVILINGADDHIHFLCLLSRKFAMMDIIKESKTETSKWIKKQGPSYLDFQWQAGYGVFSVSQSNVEQVRDYIANQEQHHLRMSFQDEFRELCKRHEIAIDERYVWD